MSLDPLTLYMIRHGEIELSLSGRHISRTDIALTAADENEVRALASTLAAIRFAHVFTSLLQRARRTCILAGLGASAEVASAFAEWDFGDYDGRHSEDILATRPGWTRKR